MDATLPPLAQRDPKMQLLRGSRLSWVCSSCVWVFYWNVSGWRKVTLSLEKKHQASLWNI